jgi:ATP-dependent DNA helicase RecQ
MALAYPTTIEALSHVAGVGPGKAKKFGQNFVKLIQEYVAENDIKAVSDIVIKSSGSRSQNKIHIIQHIDRKIDLEEIAAAKSLKKRELLKEMEQLCYAGTKLNIGYHIDNILSKDQQEEVYDYFMQAETDNIKEAREVLEGDFSEEELRLMRIKFLSEVAN